MIITTTPTIPKKEITEIVGIARGSSVRSRHFGHDIFAGLKTLVGGEVRAYTKLQAESREQAIERMKKDAMDLGADAVVNVRMESSMIMNGTSEMHVYGTAVKLQ